MKMTDQEVARQMAEREKRRKEEEAAKAAQNTTVSEDFDRLRNTVDSEAEKAKKRNAELVELMKGTPAPDPVVSAAAPPVAPVPVVSAPAAITAPSNIIQLPTRMPVGGMGSAPVLSAPSESVSQAPSAAAIMLESLKTPVKTDAQIQEQVSRMGILDRAELADQYNAELDARNSAARSGVAGSAAGAMTGALLSKLLNPSYSPEQAIQMAMPSLASVQSAVGVASKDQERADLAYPVALNTYYNALTRYTDRNDTAKAQNRQVDLEMFKQASKKPDLQHKTFTDPYGRETMVTHDDGGNVVRTQVLGQTGSNKIGGEIKSVESSIDKLASLYASISDEVGDDAAQQNKFVAAMAANTGDPKFTQQLDQIRQTARTKSARLQAVKSLIAQYQLNEAQLKLRANEEAQAGYNVKGEYYTILKEVFPTEWEKLFVKKNTGKFNPANVGDAAPAANTQRIYNVTPKKKQQ